ncbi:hypothetical protein ACFVZ8_25105 [Streptomyces sp. NPDC059558]|uniref:Small hydrophobic membrane protein n=1 Tax=Streptomyces virginiae TaxID=1961 RepID=A0A0L8M0Q4_STRVG|nr:MULTISPECIES: hypothetical protein [Streptomyces]ARE78269.1 hypothetical protein B6R96_33535 [Streptomyces sp. Sge12]KOG43996.1 hypothetical protein ADK75_37630 [Streptomyces virginiae]KOU21735.1 hypothetical protein ADK51_21330 [Streptomyces sp. WM6368]
MLFLVGALLVLGLVLGVVAHVPVPVSVVGGLAIALWLALFAARERLSGHRRAGRLDHGRGGAR